MNQNNNKPPLGAGRFEQTFSVTAATVSILVLKLALIILLPVALSLSMQ